ncbi:MAG: hypothetical protein WAO19_04850 [Candidatus Kryptoniota bacterium]
MKQRIDNTSKGSSIEPMARNAMTHNLCANSAAPHIHDNIN